MSSFVFNRRNNLRVGTTREWVNDDKIVIFEQTIPLNIGRLVLWLPHDAYNQNNCCILCSFKYNIWPVQDVTKIKWLTLKCVMSPHKNNVTFSDAVPVPERPWRIAMVMYGGILQPWWWLYSAYILYSHGEMKWKEKKKL